MKGPVLGVSRDGHSSGGQAANILAFVEVSGLT